MTPAEKMATVRFEGRDIPMPETIAASDELLKQALVPHLGAEIANATISRTTTDERMIVTLVKRAGPKGSHLLDALIAAPEAINPALGLGWMVKWNDARGTLQLPQLIDLQPALEEAIRACDLEDRHTSRAVASLTKADPTTASLLIEGF